MYLAKRVKKWIKKQVEALFHCEIEWLGVRTIAIIGKENKTDAWFSYHTQLRSIFERYQINLVVDVGANEGQFAKTIRSFYSGKILSFEPVSSTFEKLAQSASSDRMWYVYQIALGMEEGTHTIHLADATDFSSFLKTNDYAINRFGKGVESNREETVTVSTLDIQLSALSSEDTRIFLKMDTQGYDIEVFRGLGEKIRHVVALQSEMSLIPIYEGMPHWTESITAYEKAGFLVVGMFPVNIDMHSDHIIEYDCVMTKAV